MTDSRPVPHRPASIRTRVIAVLAAYALLTAAVLAVLLMYLRTDSISSGQKVLAGFAELANEQTAGTLQSIERALRAAESLLAAASDTGTVDVDQLRPQFEELSRDRPFRTSILFID
ncbi:MAG: hypothetical protein Q7U75_15625 [Desulfobacterales bacterium]|nr:hypothetical protein [Desulfobacterales bacterium]